MLCPQPLHCISAPANEGVTSADEVKWKVRMIWDDNNQQSMNALDHLFWWGWQQHQRNNDHAEQQKFSTDTFTSTQQH